MAESDFSTEQGARRKSSGILAKRQVDIRKLDIITARHTQSLAILRTILADLSDEPVLSMDIVASSLWAAQTLLEQAQEAAVTL